MDEVRIISAQRDDVVVYFRKLWRFRGFIGTFAIRDLRVKYAQTFFGIAWILLQPIPSVVIFSFFFGMLIRVDTGVLPYPVFALVGMIGWNYFSNLTSGIGNSLLDSQHILKKVFFPKLILPLSKIVVGAVDFLVAFALIIVAMILFKVYPGRQIVFFPLFFLLNILCGFSIGIWTAALSFRYRDIMHIVPYIIGFCIWLTPVFYPMNLLPPKIAALMYFNPMALVIEGYRFTLAGDQPPSANFLISIIPVLLLFLLGLWYFRKVENEIADVI